MEEQKRDNRIRNRNTAIFLIGAGLFLLLENRLGPFLVLALLLVGIGVYMTGIVRNRKGIALIAFGALLIVIQDWAILVGLMLILFVFLYYQTKKAKRSGYEHRKHSLAGSIRWDKEPWVLRDTSIWFAFGEVRMDLTLAIVEQPETTVLLQGGIGDIDIIVPEDMGVAIEASLVFGPLNIQMQREQGMMSKLHWKSANYDSSGNKVKLIVSYLVGDIDVKII